MGKYKGQIKMEEKDWKNKMEKNLENTRDKWSGSVKQTYLQ